MEEGGGFFPDGGAFEDFDGGVEDFALVVFVGVEVGDDAVVALAVGAEIVAAAGQGGGGSVREGYFVGDIGADEVRGGVEFFYAVHGSVGAGAAAEEDDLALVLG